MDAISIESKRKLAQQRLELWKRGVRKDYEKAARILRKSEGIAEAEAYECVNTAIGDMLWQWRKVGPPQDVANWASYIAHSAFHVHIDPPRKDARLLVFLPPVADERNPQALDGPDDQIGPEELAVRRELFLKVWVELANLPTNQILAVLLWAMGRSSAEAGQALGVSEERARVLKHKALKTLREKCAG